MSKYAIAIHGGAGTILPHLMTEDKEKAYKKALTDAIEAGERILKNGGDAIDSVQAAVVSLENNPLFNAGRGSVFTHTGIHEMDASIMEGKTLNCGAVSGVTGVVNPIELARSVMDKTEHVYLSGQGAIAFAESIGTPFADPSYFHDDFRYNQFQQALKTDTVQLDHTKDAFEQGEKKFGTVGAVALDMKGNLAAATSTGGMTNKKYGRVGDSPIIGAGTYANNSTCAVSCTGHGEFFIRAVVAYDVSCLMEYKGLSLEEACKEVVSNKLVALGGEGGLVAIDKEGNISLPFNSDGMYRAKKKSDEAIFVAIYK